MIYFSLGGMVGMFVQTNQSMKTDKGREYTPTHLKSFSYVQYGHLLLQILFLAMKRNQRKILLCSVFQLVTDS